MARFFIASLSACVHVYACLNDKCMFSVMFLIECNWVGSHMVSFGYTVWMFEYTVQLYIYSDQM